MERAEIDVFLTEERVCRVATAGPDGPHLTPLWFVWDDQALWLWSIVRSQRWTDLTRDPRAAVLVDAGIGYGELRGVELRGRFAPVGEAPRADVPHPELEVPERLFAAKYAGGGTTEPDGRHGWLRLAPEKITSWDFRKL